MKTYHAYFLTLAFVFCWISAFSQGDTDAKTLVKQGIALHDEGKYPEAIAKYQQALKAEPDNASANYELAYTLFTTGKEADAIPYLEKVVKLDPESPSAYDMLGSIYDDLNQGEKAINYFESGLKADPNYQRLHFNMAITYYRLKKYTDAENAAIKAIKLDPKHASSQRIFAMAANKQGKLGCSLLGWCGFLLLEPATKRSEEAMAYVKAIINNGIKKTGDNSVTLTVQANNIASMMMPMAVTNATSGKKDLSAVDSLNLQLTSLFGIIHTITNDKDQPFVKAFYSDYFDKMGKSGNMPAFTRYISVSVYKDNMAWLKDHDKELGELDKWIQTTQREM